MCWLYRRLFGDGQAYKSKWHYALADFLGRCCPEDMMLVSMEHLAVLLDVAIFRGEMLGYDSDDDYRQWLDEVNDRIAASGLTSVPAGTHRSDEDRNET